MIEQAAIVADGFFLIAFFVFEVGGAGLVGKIVEARTHFQELSFGTRDGQVDGAARGVIGGHVPIGDGIGHIGADGRFSFRFNGNKVTVIPTSCPDLSNIAESLAQGTGDMIENEKIADICSSFLRKSYGLLEPKLFGRLEMR